MNELNGTIYQLFVFRYVLCYAVNLKAQISRYIVSTQNIINRNENAGYYTDNNLLQFAGSPDQTKVVLYSMDH